MSDVKRAALGALIERLEKATGPDRALDAIIDSMFRLQTGTPLPNGNLQFSHGWLASEPYTASIDAALSLVPEGMVAVVMALETGRGKAAILYPMQRPEPLIGEVCGTPALALCIAALKARLAALGGPSDGAAPRSTASASEAPPRTEIAANRTSERSEA